MSLRAAWGAEKRVRSSSDVHIARTLQLPKISRALFSRENAVVRMEQDVHSQHMLTSSLTCMQGLMRARNTSDEHCPR